MNSLKLTRLLNYPPATRLLIINLTVGLLWGASLFLAKLGIPFLTIPFGVFALLAPGFCLAILLEQLSELTSDPGIFFLWVILLSYVITPIGIWGISQGLLHQYPVNVVIVPFLLWWGFCLVAAMAVIFSKRRPTIFQSLAFDPKTKKEIIAILILFLAIMLLNFMIYPLMPEADGYLYLNKWDPLRANPSLLATETRGLFFVFVNFVATVLKLDPYWVFKAFLPLSHVTIVVACYTFVRKFISDSRLRIILALSPLFFPVVLQEILISRPQSVLLIAFVPSIVILADIISKRANLRQLYWLVGLLVVGVIGMKIHSLFAIIAAIVLPTFVIILWREIKKVPIDALAIALGCLVLVSPILIASRVFFDAWNLTKFFAEAFAHSHFEFWFIDNYRNVDGNQAGWPGILALFYYGYNLGLVFPILFLWLLIRKQAGTFKRILKAEYWPIVCLFAFFFFIAEIAPRFQVAFLPDRAWLFLALIFTLVLPFMVSELGKKAGPRFIVSVAAMSLASVLAGSAITYAKQGWVLPNEVEAAKFMQSNLPENALFLGQGSLKVMARYYAKRTFVRPDPPVFLQGDRSALDIYLKDKEATRHLGPDVIVTRKYELSRQLRAFSTEVVRSDLTEEQLRDIFRSLANTVEHQRDYLPPPPLDRETFPESGGPIYLVYNQRKFGSLYGTRSWWRESNFYGANLKRLSETYPVVYNKQGVIIWKAQE